MPTHPSPWRWIPTLYFCQGLPYAAVMALSVVLYKNLGLSNTEVALLTSWLYLPWVIKPLWSPVVDLVGSPRHWIIALQFVVAGLMAVLALALPGPWAVSASLAAFWVLAFASATHDIAADGFYLLPLSARQQAAFVGVRSVSWRLAMITGQGGVVVLAGLLLERGLAPGTAWAWVFGLLAAAFAVLAAYHVWALPRPEESRPAEAAQRLSPAAWLAVLAAWFRRDDLSRVLAFLLLYRLAEAQLLKLVVPFLLDAPTAGGLGLTTQQVGVVYGTVGVAALIAGGLLGGWVVARVGLRRALWPLMLCMHAPNLIFVGLAAARPADLSLIGAALAVEQFGYGFGFAAYLVYLLRISEGPHRIAFYAIGTGFMALGMMLPGMWAGWLQARLGYLGFFAWACLCTLPSFVAAACLRWPAESPDERP